MARLSQTGSRRIEARGASPCPTVRIPTPWSRPMSPSDVEVAEEAARAAGEVLLALRTRGDLTGRPLGDAGDAAAQQAIAEVLRARRPDDVVFSEEAVDDP